MVPSRKGYGIMQAIQRPLWKKLKKWIPGFIHGMTTAEILDLVKANIGADW